MAVYSYVIIIFSLSMYLIQESTQNTSDCHKDDRKFRFLRLSVSSRRNQTGEWADAITVQASAPNDSDNTKVDVIHTAEECEGNRIITIKGTNNAFTEEISKRRLAFHSSHGKNVILLNSGRTVQKIFPSGDYTSVFTNRPLDDNEIFQVKIEKKNGTFSAVAIGVIAQSPKEIVIENDMAYKDSLPYYFAVYHYHYTQLMGKITNEGKMKDTNDITEGDTLGVMRSEGAKLHFFYNGIIQYVTWKDVPSELYGYFELRGNGYRASIVDA